MTIARNLPSRKRPSAALWGIIGSAVAGIGLGAGIATAVMKVSRVRVVPWFVQNLDGGASAVGNSGDLLIAVTSWGDYLSGLLK